MIETKERGRRNEKMINFFYLLGKQHEKKMKIKKKLKKNELTQKRGRQKEFFFLYWEKSICIFFDSN